MQHTYGKSYTNLIFTDEINNIQYLGGLYMQKALVGQMMREEMILIQFWEDGSWVAQMSKN